MSTHVTKFEHDLAHHIEIVKSNMEEEVSVTKQNEKQIWERIWEKGHIGNFSSHEM